MLKKSWSNIRKTISLLKTPINVAPRSGGVFDVAGVTAAPSAAYHVQTINLWTSMSSRNGRKLGRAMKNGGYQAVNLSLHSLTRVGETKKSFVKTHFKVMSFQY